jgi:ADP-ribose pyrophosphatase YjhB (NUDIX family)
MTRVMKKAGVILTNHNSTKVLVVINKNCMENLKYGLPKGHREKNEPMEACASRELKEETGIILRVSPKDPKIIVSETTYYLIKAKHMPHPRPQDNTEIGDARWIEWKELFCTDCNRGLRLVRDKIRKGNHFMKRMRDLVPRSVGIIRNKPKQIQNEAELGSCEKGEGNATRNCKIPQS